MKKAIFILSLLFFGSCVTKEIKSTDKAPTANFYIPAGFPAPVYDLTTTYSTDKFELGRKLFFDPVLSIDSTISCASCHLPQAAFSDQGKSFSTGIENQKGIRNSPALINLAWQPRFMWDGGVNHIEVQPLAPITNPLEMGSSLTPIIEKLNKNKTYKKLFKKTFAADSITSADMFKALAHFMSCLISSESKYDRYLKGEVKFTSSEREGLDIFTKNCSGCHPPPLFTDFSYRNNGIGPDADTPDAGRYIITQKNSDSLKFKIPTLRNIELTFPYMHDGRMNTLEAVVDHYASGNFPIKVDSLIPEIKLDAKEKDNLLQFLKTLTDKNFIANKNFIP